MIGRRLMGWAMQAAGGYRVRRTAGFALPPVVQQDAVAYGLLRQAHGLIAVAFFALILGHLTVALIHGFVRRDGVLETMGFARPTAPAPEPDAPEPDEADQPDVGPSEPSQP